MASHENVTSPSLIGYGGVTSRHATSTSDFIRILYWDNRHSKNVTCRLGAENENAEILNRILRLIADRIGRLDSPFIYIILEIFTVFLPFFTFNFQLFT